MKSIVQRIVMSSLVWIPMVAAEPDWQRVIDDPEQRIQVYVRDVPGSDLQAFRGTTRVQSRLTAAIALLEDHTVAPQWMHNCKAIDIVERVSDTHTISYMINDAPWPVTDRDVVVESQLSQADDGTLTLSVRHREGVFPANDDMVRIAAMEGFWRFTPEDDGWLAVEYQVHAEPGGGLPSWLANSVVQDTPYYTLQAFKQWVAKPDYQTAQRDYVREPAALAAVGDVTPATAQQ
ncbi:START domain-containing protein [Bacterioplanes sanyensis]|nr:START domain-containing protein [Bacterioplanes sanyensis]